MKIITAKTAGFCMGVRRAVELAVDKARDSDERIYTLGPLIHNNQTLRHLEGRGVVALDEDNPPAPGAKILIRAHGVPQETQDKYERMGCVLIDGTCPKVKTVHRVIAKYRAAGYAVVIAGDQGHAEVVGLQSYAGPSGHLVCGPDDIDALPDLEKICLVSQTTFDRVTFDEIARRLKSRFPSLTVVIKKTICSATNQRQDEARALSAQVDAMIVIGGNNSANTMRLARICRESAPLAQHVETEVEIDWEKLAESGVIGVTAGASTPGWMIKRIVDHLQVIDSRRRTAGPAAACVLLFTTLAHFNVFVAAGGAAMYYASTNFQSVPFRWTGAGLIFLYLLSMYLWNTLTSIDMTQHFGLRRYRFYNQHRRMLLCVTVGCVACMLGISFLVSRSLFLLMLIATAAGSLYHFSIVPLPLRRRLRYSRLKDIPTSRDLFTALAWAVLVTLVPRTLGDSETLTALTVALIFFWTFFLVYIRSLIFDLRDIEGDRIMGRETLVTIIGEKRARQLVLAATLFALAMMMASAATLHFVLGPETSFQAVAVLCQVPVFIYLWFFMSRGRKLPSASYALFSFLVDGQFLVAGIGAWIAVMLAGR